MDWKTIENNPLLRHSFEMAVLVEAYCTKLYDLKRYDLARQLFRSGTSVAANIFESQHAESKSDFIHKLKIAAKEAAETQFWLFLCQKANGYPSTEALLDKLLEINRLLSSIIASAKKNPQNAPH